MAFFTIYCPQGESPAQVQHDSHKRAFGVAHRMAKAHRGKEFYVMRSCSKPIVVADQAAETEAAE